VRGYKLISPHGAGLLRRVCFFRPEIGLSGCAGSPPITFSAAEFTDNRDIISENFNF